MTNGLYDVDISLTTKDLAGMIAEKKLDFASLPDQSFDNPLGESTGGGTIFGPFRRCLGSRHPYRLLLVR
jgi:iron only hydrogenase large subunit-like protein